MKSVFSKSTSKLPTTAKGKTLKEIEADLEAKGGNEDLDDPIAPSEVGGMASTVQGGASTVPWKTVVSDEKPSR